MHSSCRNPSLSLGYRAPHSSFNDYYDRLARNPISLSPPPSCCCCCSNSIYRLPINPSLICGLRQSTLIQWSPSRRLILNVRNQCFSRFSVSDLDRNCSYGTDASFKERGGGRKVGGRWGKGRYGYMIYEERGKGDYSGDVGDEFEMMLSLLTEEVGEECFGVRERNGSSWRMQVENQKRENSDGISYRSRKKNVGSVGLESTSKQRDQEYNVARYREEIRRQKEDKREEEKENISRCENCRVRIEGSSSKSGQAYDVAQYKTRKEDRREEVMENISRSENRRVRKEEGSLSKSDQAYDIAQYKTRKEDRREEGMENISRSENRRVRKEGSTWKSDQEYDTARYGEETKRQREDRREEGIEHILTSDNRKVRKEGSTLRINQEYDTARYREEINRQKEDRREEERENLLRSENRRLRKEGSSCSSYYSVSSAGEFESDTELQVKDDRIVGQSSSESRREQRRNEDVSYDAEVKEKVERHGDYVKEHEILMKKENNGEGFCGESTGVEHDWRKKSEKKLNEVVIEQTESKKLAEERMRLSKIERTRYARSADFQQQYNDRKEKSALAVNINEGTTQDHNLNDDRISEQSESRIKYKQFTGMPELHSTVVEATSSSQKRYSGVEKNESTPVSLVQETKGAHCETAGRVARQDVFRREPQQIAEMSEIDEIDKRGASSSLSETRMKNLEDNSTMVIGLVNDREEKHQKTGQLITRQTGSRIKLHQMTGISETEELDTESTPLSRTKADIRMKKQEEKSELAYVEAKVTDIQRVSEESTSRKERYLTSAVEGKVKDTRRVSQNSTDRQERYSTSVVEGKVTDTQRVSQISTNQQERYSTSVVEGKVTDTQRVSEKSTNRLERLSTSEVESVDKTRERHRLIDKGVLQIEPRKGTRRPVKASSFNEGMPKEASSTYKSLKLIPESIVQQIGDDDDKRSSQPIVMPPLHIESTSEFSSESFRSGLSELPVQREESSPAPGSDIYGGNIRGDSGGEPLNFISHEDALGSADRLQQSSTHFVREFVEKVRHEVSTSEGQKEEKMHETQLVQKNEEGKQKSVGQDGLGDSRRSSRGSGAKGPSDEMWHVADQSIQAPPKIEAAPESTVTTSESGVVKRTGRSMWNVIGDIVQMRWASSRSETHTSKSGGKSSPNQSTGSEAWFSGHEADENIDENVKRENTILLQETSSSEKQQSGGIRSETQELSSPISLRNNIKHAGVDSSSFSSTESGSALKGGSLPSLQGTSSGTGIVDPSLPLPAIRMRRSSAVKDIPEASKTDASGSGKMEIEQAISVRLPEVSATEAKDGELKRRKFQRSDHVLKDRFDEWEEAHTLETEQRKIDERFMREALLEARKGADMWEVPVGAVLVQHGKIIARGYNLVEDLRDSTAHAEMICIREASNVLRTWRLSETTLYVTLEPCPMCAGAILQARVDTVVWGAPNKLLGADGSWIRLFPNGSGGNDLEVGDKAAAGPVHPFHPNITIRRGILSSECADVMQQFFQLRRKKKEKKAEQPPTPPSCLPVSTHPSKFLTKMHEAFHMMFCL